MTLVTMRTEKQFNYDRLGVEWKTGKNTLDNFDCAVLSEMFSIPYPKACQRYLEYTDSKRPRKNRSTEQKRLKYDF